MIKLLRILSFILIAVLGAGAYFFMTRKPVPAPPVENKITEYQGVNKSEFEEKYGKVLIVYYSFTGITRQIASELQEKTGGDMYAIQTRNDYPASGELYFTSVKQIYLGPLPELKEIKADISNYDTILIGSPVWWYTASPPLRSYLKKTDFQGKTIGIFCTQGGNAGNYFKDVASILKNANTRQPLNLKLPRKQKPEELSKHIDIWLEQFAKK